MDQDRLFILTPHDSLYDLKHAIPMATSAEITAFDEPQLLFALFGHGDLDFKIVSKATQIIDELDQGRLIDCFSLMSRKDYWFRISSNASKTNRSKICVSLL